MYKACHLSLLMGSLPLSGVHRDGARLSELYFELGQAFFLEGKMNHAVQRKLQSRVNTFLSCTAVNFPSEIIDA